MRSGGGVLGFPRTQAQCARKPRTCVDHSQLTVASFSRSTCMNVNAQPQLAHGPTPACTWRLFESISALYLRAYGTTRSIAFKSSGAELKVPPTTKQRFKEAETAAKGPQLPVQTN